MKIILQILFFLSFSEISFANSGNETGLEIPRFVSIKSNEANIRVGPSKNYPIIIKYIRENYPLKILDEYNEWRKVEDVEKNIGWIHNSLISGKRTGLIVSKKEKSIEIYNSVNGSSIGKIGIDNIVLIKKCKISWCVIKFDNYSGWVNKKNIWGVKNKEIFKMKFTQMFEDLYWDSINFLISKN